MAQRMLSNPTCHVFRNGLWVVLDEECEARQWLQLQWEGWREGGTL
jgi:hypothetical protein